MTCQILNTYNDKEQNNRRSFKKAKNEKCFLCEHPFTLKIFIETNSNYENIKKWFSTIKNFA